MLAGIKTDKVSALYIMGDDPAGSDKGSKDILNRLEFLVVQDIFLTETAKLADVVLPACSWAEKSGTVTSLERRLQQISRAEEPLGESKPDWDIVQTLAKKMGSSMHYGTPADILREIRSTVSLYADVALGGIWPRERSPLAGADVDLSLRSDTVMKNEVITSDRLLFSSGTMIGRSSEIGTLCRTKAEV
jgi:anaerobic selenocysteine-containing dehydrogenase